MFIPLFISCLLLFVSSVGGGSCDPQVCTPFYDNLPTLKSNATNKVTIGYIASKDVKQENLNMARWAFYLLNNNASILPNIRLELQAIQTDSVPSVVGASAELIIRTRAKAIIVDLSEASTQFVVNIATAYGIPVLSTSSSTNVFDNKAAYSNLYARIAVTDNYQCAALLSMMKGLNVSAFTYVYSADVYGLSALANCIEESPSYNITIDPQTAVANNSLNNAKKLANSKVIFIGTNPDDGLPLMKAIQKLGLYGKEYFYVISLKMSLRVTVPEYPMLDGSVILVETMYKDYIPYYKKMLPLWNAANATMFPGDRPPKLGLPYATFDAANMYASSLAALIDAGVPLVNITGRLLHNQMVSMPLNSMAGDFNFDSNADRPGSFFLFNVVFTQENTNVTSASPGLIAYYECATSEFINLDSTLYYFNGSTTNPFFIKRFWEKCSFSICNYRGNCSANAECICDEGFSGKFCQSRDKNKVSGALLGEIIAPVGVVLIVSILVAMFLVHKRRKALEKEVREKQRSNIPRGDLKLLDRIGRGAAGEVMKGTFRGTEVAVKRLLTQNASKSLIDEFSMEVAIMCGLRHPNIIMFMGSCYDPAGNEMLLVMELMTRGSLHDVLHNPKVQLPFDLQLHLAMQAAQGMNFLHASTPPIIHCDLKSHNILLDDKWTARISDFGITRFKAAAKTNKSKANSNGDDGTSSMSSLGTIFWTAPEVLEMSGSHSEKSDCYAFGVVLWELFHRLTPYDGIDVMTVAIEVVKGRRPEISPSLPEGIQFLIQACWHQDPSKRPSFEQIVENLRQMSLLNPLHDLGAHTQGRVQAPTGQVYLVETIIANVLNMMDIAPRATNKAITIYSQHLRTTLESYEGYEVSSNGVVFVMSFSSLKNAIDWCSSAQISLMHCSWPDEALQLPMAARQDSGGEMIWRGPRVRMALHAGLATTDKDSLGHLIYKGAVPERAHKILMESTDPGIFVSSTIHEELITEKGQHLSEPIVNPCERIQMPNSTTFYVLPQKLSKRKAPGMEDAVLSLNTPDQDVLVEGLDGVNANYLRFPSWYIMWNELTVHENIGRGNIGDYYRATHNGKEVAVKVLVNQKLKEADLVRLTADVAMLSKMNHPNLLPIVGHCVEEHHISIISAYVSRGNLRSILSDNGVSVSLVQGLKIARDIAAGMEFLANHPDPEVRIHDNFKSHNILITNNWEVKITDFGQTNIKDLARTMTSVSNVSWTAPEILEGESICLESAVYSFGIILWEIITRKVPFENEHPIKIVTKILSGHRPAIPKEKIPLQCTEILEGCWNRQTKRRPTWRVIQTELSVAIENLQ